MDGGWNFVWSADDPSPNQLGACPRKLGGFPELASVELSRKSSQPHHLALAAFLWSNNVDGDVLVER
jgi:hypothetical protein